VVWQHSATCKIHSHSLIFYLLFHCKLWYWVIVLDEFYPHLKWTCTCIPCHAMSYHLTTFVTAADMTIFKFSVDFEFLFHFENYFATLRSVDRESYNLVPLRLKIVTFDSSYMYNTCGVVIIEVLQEFVPIKLSKFLYLTCLLSSSAWQVSFPPLSFFHTLFIHLIFYIVRVRLSVCCIKSMLVYLRIC